MSQIDNNKEWIWGSEGIGNYSNAGHGDGRHQVQSSGAVTAAAQFQKRQAHHHQQLCPIYAHVGVQSQQQHHHNAHQTRSGLIVHDENYWTNSSNCCTPSPTSYRSQSHSRSTGTTTATPTSSSSATATTIHGNSPEERKSLAALKDEDECCPCPDSLRRPLKLAAQFPLFISVLTGVQILIFIYYALDNRNRLDFNRPVPIESPLIYRPDKQLQVWRFLSYSLLHAGWVHVLFNVTMQMIVGIPLETLHGSPRMAALYSSGVLGGALLTSIVDPHVCLIGASGGVYALLAGHAVNLLLNYNFLHRAGLQLLTVFMVTSVDVGLGVYGRYLAAASTASVPDPLDNSIEYYDEEAPIAFTAHIGGFLIGFSVALLLFESFEPTLKVIHHLFWWLACGLYIAFMTFAIVFNLVLASVTD